MTAYRRLVAVAAALLLLLAGCAGHGQAGGAGGAAAPAGAGAAPPWAWQMPQCVAYRPADYQAPAHRRSVQVHRPHPGATAQVERYQPGWGRRAVAEIRKVVRRCARYEYGELGDPAGYLAQHRVVDTGFAGDQSLLVESVHLTPPQARTWYAAVVRRGDEVVTLRTSGLGAAATRCLAAAPSATCA